MKLQVTSPKARLSNLLTKGWKVQTFTYRLPSKIRELGFRALYFISNGDEIIGFYF